MSLDPHTPATADGDSLPPSPTPKEEPVGHDGTRVLITEKGPVWSISGAIAGLALLLFLIIFGLSIWGFITAANTLDAGISTSSTVLLMAASIIGFILSILLMLTMVKVQSPGHVRVLNFFGNYVGTLRTVGISLVPPLTSSKKVSVKARNFETTETKVNDYNGNPVIIAAIVVWQVADSAKAVFAVEDYDQFIHSQAESALRHVATRHPYDSPVDGLSSLRGSTDEVSAELANEVAARVAVAGLEIIEARISSLSYAPEIAQAMLQRQQAAAIVDARETIVEGAVSMVQSALDSLEDRDIVDLDPERRAAMVSNLLVVLCSDSNAQPVINAGGLYT